MISQAIGPDSNICHAIYIYVLLNVVNMLIAQGFGQKASEVLGTGSKSSFYQFFNLTIFKIFSFSIETTFFAKFRKNPLENFLGSNNILLLYPKYIVTNRRKVLEVLLSTQSILCTESFAN